MQGNAKTVELNRHDVEQRRGEESLEDVERTTFDVCPAALVLDGDVENCYDCSSSKQRPGKEREQADEGLNPWQVKNLCSELAHHGKKIRNRVVNDSVDPLQEGVKNR